MGAYWKCNKKKYVGFTAIPAPVANGSIKIIDFLSLLMNCLSSCCGCPRAAGKKERNTDGRGQNIDFGLR